MIMHDIYYINSQMERIGFNEWPYMLTGGNLFDGEYDEIEESDHIQGFERGIQDRSLNIDINAITELGFVNAINRLEEVTEKDIVNMQSGKLYVGNSYLKCWITGTSKDRWINGVGGISNSLLIKTDYPYWITEENYSFSKSDESIESLKWLEYPYEYPYEYTKVRNIRYINNNNFTESGFRMIIYGPCINPLIRISGHVYELKTTLYDGEYAVIDSSTRYSKDRKIIKVKVDGTEESLYNSRNKESEIWKKIPPGRSIVSWNGDFGFDIILFNERGTPRWILQ